MCPFSLKFTVFAGKTYRHNMYTCRSYMMLAPCNLLLGEVLKAVEALLETENMFFLRG